ncbi:hypothetical protein GGR55DRAFT_83272 [Xylaria sp. FL0064]|nr:hypothetical protein GGR55DRAFT_83272 [Xylaria sp. FL0064]
MQSQPLPGNQSRYFYNGIGGRPASQNRGRLTPLPHHPSRSSGAIASLRRPMPPFHPRQQPHPFLASGPAAAGYIPQQSVRYYRNSALQEPIIPLRDEFSGVSNIGGVDKSIDFQSLEQARPNSVPSHYSQTSLNNFEFSSQEIPRPASVAHTSIQASIDPLLLQPLCEGGSLGVSAPTGSDSEDQYPENDFIPPKRTLPFPTKQAKTVSAHSQTQRENMITDLPSSQVVPTVTKQDDQSITEKSQSKNKKMMRKNLDSATDGTAAKSLRAFKRPRITFTNWHPPRHEFNTSISRSTNEHANKSKCQESQPSRNARKNTKGGRLASTTDKVSTKPTDAASPPVMNSSHPHLVDVDRDTRHGQHSVTHPPILEDSQSTMIGSQPEASQQSLPIPNSIRDKPSVVKSNTLTNKKLERSISQATTVSTTSTKLSCAAKGDEDISKPKEPFNRMSMVETTMVLQRDVTDIVGTRLQQGNADVLDVLGGEILMKMAMEDKEICEAVKRML